MAKRKATGTLDSFLVPKKDKMEGNNKVFNPRGHWQIYNKDMLIFTPENNEHRYKVLGVDLDGTVIITKSGKTFPQNEFDWKLFSPLIPKIFEQYYSDGFKVVIFTNQKGIQSGKVNRDGFKRKIEKILSEFTIPIQVFVSLGTLMYRKPCIGMWEYLEKSENGNISINRSESIYVGDGAGRIATKNRKKDFSAVDRLFALNIGAKFFTPEEFFLKSKEKEQFILPAFNPAALLETNASRFEPADVPIPNLRQEVIVLVGLPGCGKTKFAMELLKEHKYVVVNRDTMKTWQKCVETTKVYLKRGQSVVIDNTNCDILSRKRYTDLAKSFGVDCRCFYFICDIAQANHHCKFRILAGTDTLHEEVGTMVLRMLKSKFEEPTLEEGFSSIVRVNFVPCFDNEDQRNLYRLYLCDT